MYPAACAAREKRAKLCTHRKFANPADTRAHIPRPLRRTSPKAHRTTHLIQSPGEPSRKVFRSLQPFSRAVFRRARSARGRSADGDFFLYRSGSSGSVHGDGDRGCAGSLFATFATRPSPWGSGPRSYPERRGEARGSGPACPLSANPALTSTLLISIIFCAAWCCVVLLGMPMLAYVRLFWVLGAGGGRGAQEGGRSW